MTRKKKEDWFYKEGKFYSNQDNTKIFLCTQNSLSYIPIIQVSFGILLYDKLKEYNLTGVQEWILNFSTELDEYTEFKGSVLITTI